MLIPILELILSPLTFTIQLLLIKPIESMGGGKIDLDKNILNN